MSDKQYTNSGGIGFFTLLFLLFLALKLGVGNTIVMGWSWWLISAPLWGPLALIGAVLMLMAFVAVINESTKVSFKRSTTRKQDSAMFKLRKRFKKSGMSTHEFLSKADTILEMNKTSTEPVNPFSLLDIDVPDSVSKSIRRHEEKVKKDRFSLKRWWNEGCTGLTLFQRIGKWWKDGNKKAKEKKKKESFLEKIKEG